MSVYTVHAPPADRQGVSAPEDYVFVRDGLYVWALVFGPLWMLVRRLWLVLLLYVVLMAAIGFGVWAAGLRNEVGPWPAIFVALLIGLEAGTLWRWTLSRRGFRNVGVVVARDLEQAERRFFDRLAEADDMPLRRDPPQPPSSAPHAPPRPSSAPPVIGLFPEPGAPR